MDKKILSKLLAALLDHQATIFETGHTFWHCDMHDKNDKGEYKPFRYYQTNRTVGMSTCGNCYKLMELRKQIREVEKLMGIELTPLYTNVTDKNAVKRMSVKNGSEWNPNFHYIS